MVETSIVPK